MAITSTPSLASSAQALVDAANGSGSKAASATTEAQNRFLKLLTTQLKNQDPLNPLDNAQVTSQLAQISTVDGIEKLNATLQKLLTSSVDGEAMQAAALVGHQVMVAGRGLTLGDQGAVGGLELKSAADQVVVTIKDSNGIVMRTLNLGELAAGTSNFSWDGKTDAGAQAVNGSYGISILAKRGSEKIEVSPLELAGVISINRSSQGVTLDLGQLGLARLADVKQIF